MTVSSPDSLTAQRLVRGRSIPLGYCLDGYATISGYRQIPIHMIQSLRLGRNGRALMDLYECINVRGMQDWFGDVPFLSGTALTGMQDFWLPTNTYIHHQVIEMTMQGQGFKGPI